MNGAAPASAGPTPAPWRDRSFLAVAALSLALKLALCALAADATPVLDEAAYLGHAGRLAAGEAWNTNFRPPLYVAFLGTGLFLGAPLGALRAAQALLATLCLLPVYTLAHGIGGRRSARLAAGLVAFDPVLTGYSHLLWSETLYLALLLPALALLVRDARAARPRRWLGAGLLLGLAGLARPQLLSFLPLLVPWAAWQARGRGRAWLAGAALLVAGAALVVLPWSARNLRASGVFFLVDVNGPYNFAVGAEPGARYVDKDDRWSLHWAMVDGRTYVEAAAADPAGAQRTVLARAAGQVSEDPVGFAAKSLWEATHLLTLDDFVARHLRNRWYGDGAPRWLPGAYALAAAAFTAALLAAGLLGLLAAPASPFRGIALVALAHALLVFGLAYSLSRYAVPLRPLLAITAAWLVCQPRAALARRFAPRLRTLAAVLALLLLLASWSRDLPLLADMVDTGGALHRFRTLP